MDYGDGSGVQPLTLNPDKSFDLSHTYMDDDSYTVTVTVTDDDGGVGTGSATVTVNNVAPTVTAASDVTVIDENDVVTLSGEITDPGTQDTFTLSIDWGDGSTIETFNYAAGTTSYTVKHQYLDDNPSSDDYPISVIVTDDDGGVGTGSTTVTVKNVAPEVHTLPESQNFSGQTHELAVSFTDPGTLDIHIATINWGDGSEIEPGVVNESSGSGTVTGSHPYFVPGEYTITVVVIDDDSGEGSAESTKVVLRLPIKIDVKPGSDPNSINLGSKGKIPVGVLSGIYNGVSIDVTTIDHSSIVFAGAIA